MARAKKVEKVSPKCPFRCQTCARFCTAATALSHRFDCCGKVVAHDVVRNHWVRIENPTRAGYCTGPSRTEAPA